MNTTAYSYVRFSSSEQAKGDSLRRQTEAAQDWCKRHRVVLDQGTTLHDLGQSAFLGEHRTNADRCALAGFLKLVEQKRIPRGSYLVIENLDRLSREHVQPALLLVLGLLQAGIRIVQLKPTEMVFDDASDMAPVMMMLVELARGHGESKMKSDRVGQAWRQKKQRARKDGCILTRRLPAWIEERAGKLHLIPARAAAVKYIFTLAASGYGLTAILKKLVQDKVRPFGTSGQWARSYVGNIVRDRRVIGEFQPRRRDGSEDGPAITGYFPAVVDSATWMNARAGAMQRREKPGRTSAKVINVFSGLLKDALDGDSYFLNSTPSPDQKALLMKHRASEGKTVQRSFPFDVFERCVLMKLAEIKPSDILGKGKAPDEAGTAAATLTAVELRISELEAELLNNGNVATLAKVLRKLEDDKRGLTEKLLAAKHRAANSLTDAWDECHDLMTALDTAADPHDARLRLRSLLRRLVQSMWMLVVPRGRVRLAVVQVWFQDGKRHRDYLLAYVPPKANHVKRTEGRTVVRSLAGIVKVGDLDLRNPKDAKAIEALLKKCDVEELLLA